jgi:hypothetical protein
MKILLERPLPRPRAPPVMDETWEEHKEKIRDLYLVRRWRLEDVRKEMLSKHGFNFSYVRSSTKKRKLQYCFFRSSNYSSSKHQYTLQLKKWGFYKNGPNAIKFREHITTNVDHVGQSVSPSLDIDSVSLDGGRPRPLRDGTVASIALGGAWPLSDPHIDTSRGVTFPDRRPDSHAHKPPRQ